MKSIIYTLYISNVSHYEERLKQIGASYSLRNVLNNFWGKEFTIEPPKGKGSREKINNIYNLFEK